MDDASAGGPLANKQSSDLINALEAEWATVQPLGLDAQEEFLIGLPLSGAQGDERNALEQFFDKKWRLFENEMYREFEAKDRLRDDRVKALEAEWATQPDDAARQRFLQMILQHAVDEEDMKVANLFVKPKAIDLWHTWAKPLEDWESARSQRERAEHVRRNRDLYMG